MDLEQKQIDEKAKELTDNDSDEMSSASESPVDYASDKSKPRFDMTIKKKRKAERRAPESLATRTAPRPQPSGEQAQHLFPVYIPPTAYSTTVGSDADADDHPSTDVGGPKRKRKVSGGVQRVTKAARDEDAGYIDEGRMAMRANGVTVTTGDMRSCVPDALCSLLCNSFGFSVTKEDVRAIMPAKSEDAKSEDDKSKDAKSDQNTRFASAIEYVAGFGLKLERVTSKFLITGGPELALLKRTEGAFVVQLRVSYNKDDPKPDLHCVAYDGVRVLDNNKYTKAKRIEPSDRASPDEARKVFNSLFPGLEVRIKNVYELKRESTSFLQTLSDMRYKPLNGA